MSLIKSRKRVADLINSMIRPMGEADE